jgi:nucleoside-diphosphate-sugar epimerase
LRIAITGVSSVLGFNLALELLKSRDKLVRALIRESSSKAISALRRYKNFEPISGDVKERSSVDSLLEASDVVYHLAGISSERLCLAKPEEAVCVNVGSTAVIAEIAGKKRVKLIFPSSAAVYESGYYPEEDSPITIHRFYGLTKHTAESVIKIMADRYGLDYTIFRLSRLYGVGMRRNPIYDIWQGYLRNEPVQLYDALDSWYDFIYAEDAVKVLIAAAENKRFVGLTLNLGSGIATRVRELVAIAEEVLGRKLNVVELNNKRSFDVLNVERLKALGYEASYSIKEGLMQMKKLVSEIGFI